MFLRFNYSTSDAAGQNMVGKATFAACEWMRKNYPAIKHYNLSGNLDTDKKYSYINSLHTRGKRVIAEATIPAWRNFRRPSCCASAILRIWAPLSPAPTTMDCIPRMALPRSLSLRDRMSQMWPNLHPQLSTPINCRTTVTTIR